MCFFTHHERTAWSFLPTPRKQTPPPPGARAKGEVVGGRSQINILAPYLPQDLNMGSQPKKVIWKPVSQAPEGKDSFSCLI